MDEEKAMYILGRCNYDIGAASRLVLPWEATDEGADEEDEAYDGDDYCLKCRDGGNLIMCEHKGCRKVYHPGCIGLEEVPSGVWECSYHMCAHEGCRIHTKDVSTMCALCPTAYCDKHVPAGICAIITPINLLCANTDVL